MQFCMPRKYRNKRNGAVIDAYDYAVLRWMHKVSGLEFCEEDWEVAEYECKEVKM